MRKGIVSRFSSQGCEKGGGDVAQVKVPKKKIEWGSRVGKDKKKQKLCSLYGGQSTSSKGSPLLKVNSKETVGTKKKDTSNNNSKKEGGKSIGNQGNQKSC